MNCEMVKDVGSLLSLAPSSPQTSRIFLSKTKENLSRFNLSRCPGFVIQS